MNIISRLRVLSLCILVSSFMFTAGCGGGDSATGTVSVVTLFSDSDEEDELTGATIIVDSVLTSIVNTGTLILPVGPHTISASLEGYIAEPVNITVTEGDTTDVRVALRPNILGFSGQQGKIDSSTASFNLTYEQVLTPDVEAAIGQAVADGSLIGHATVSDVITASLHARKLKWKSSAACAGPRKVIGKLDEKVHVGAWCWEPDDQESSEKLSTSEWVPQGITSSKDATVAGTYEGLHVVLVSWYGKNNALHKGTRISFFEYPGTDEDAHYKHVLLATPYVSNGKLNLKAQFSDITAKSTLHAGGMAWYGNFLYVADTKNGFRIFDMRRIYRVHDTSGSDVLGRRNPDNGKLYGADYDFVLLEVGHTTQNIHDANDCQIAKVESEALCFSSVSLDRNSSPPALVTSEYRSKNDMKASDVGMRIVRWNLDTGSDNLEMGDAGRIISDGTYLTPTYRVQGAFMKGNEFYLSTTQDPEGIFYYEKDGDGKNPTSMPWPYGGEALSYWPSMERLWSVTERPGKRMVFWVYTNEMK